MSSYYRRTFAGMGIVLLASIVAAVIANSIASEAKSRRREMIVQAEIGRREAAAQRERSLRIRSAMRPAHTFGAAWRATARLNEKEAVEAVRSEIETLAQRQLGLVTDGAITPQAEKYLFQGNVLRIQKVSLRASGRDLVALLTWLGKVEERYPAALIEQCEFASNVGGNTALTLRLVQPLQELGAARSKVPSLLRDLDATSAAIGAIAWTRYLPGNVKRPVAIGISRNPLQPAVTSDQHPTVVMHDGAEEIAPRLEQALDGKVRSVVRGSAPMVVVDGRVFRIGDELIVGPARGRPVPEVKMKLKGIGDDRLVFHVAGRWADRPVQCEVTYLLPSFLKAR